MVTAEEIREIDAERTLAGMPHVWGIPTAEHAICRLPGDEELHLLGVGPPGTWVLRKGDPHGEEVMEVEATDLYGRDGRRRVPSPGPPPETPLSGRSGC